MRSQGLRPAHLLVRTMSGTRFTDQEVRNPPYLIANGLIGEPVPPVMTSGGPQKKNS